MLDFEQDVRYGLIRGVSNFLKTIVDFDALLLYKFNVSIDLPNWWPRRSLGNLAVWLVSVMWNYRVAFSG